MNNKKSAHNSTNLNDIKWHAKCSRRAQIDINTITSTIKKFHANAKVILYTKQIVCHSKEETMLRTKHSFSYTPTTPIIFTDTDNV